MQAELACAAAQKNLEAARARARALGADCSPDAPAAVAVVAPVAQQKQAAATAAAPSAATVAAMEAMEDAKIEVV